MKSGIIHFHFKKNLAPAEITKKVINIKKIIE